MWCRGSLATTYTENFTTYDHVACIIGGNYTIGFNITGFSTPPDYVISNGTNSTAAPSPAQAVIGWYQVRSANGDTLLPVQGPLCPNIGRMSSIKASYAFSLSCIAKPMVLHPFSSIHLPCDSLSFLDISSRVCLFSTNRISHPVSLPSSKPFAPPAPNGMLFR
jgi:hypothetical protein